MQVVDEEVRTASRVSYRLERSLVLRDEAASRRPVAAGDEDVLRLGTCCPDGIDGSLERQLEVVDVEVLCQDEQRELACLKVDV